MEDNYHLANKKGLLLNLKEYYKLNGKCVFESRVFPYTFLLKSTDKISGPLISEEYMALKNY
jgi:hypothetical protein